MGFSYWGVDNKIDQPDANGEGEILTYSRGVFMGYIGEPEKTRAALTEDMWYRSGDLGCMGADGFLKVTGRAKEIIITAGGENVAPVVLEDNIKGELGDVVSQVLVVGEGKKHLACLVSLKCEVDEQTRPTKVLSPSAVEWCKKIGCSKVPRTIEDFVSGPDSEMLSRAVHEGIMRANEFAPSHAQRVQKFRFLPIDLSVVGGELGPTLKIKRFFIYEKYGQLIDSMYGDEQQQSDGEESDDEVEARN